MADRLVIRPATIALLVLGVVLVAVAIVYFVSPAHSLPAMMPGHQAGLQRHHTTHGLAALALAVLVWIGAWFTTAPKDSQPGATR